MWEAPTPDRALEEEELSHEKVCASVRCRCTKHSSHMNTMQSAHCRTIWALSFTLNTLHKTFCTPGTSCTMQFAHWTKTFCVLSLWTRCTVMKNNTKSGSPNHFSTPVVTLVGPKKCSENFHVKEVLLKICTLQFKLRQNNYTRKSNKFLKVRGGGCQRPNVSRPQFLRSFFYFCSIIEEKVKVVNGS